MKKNMIATYELEHPYVGNGEEAKIVVTASLLCGIASKAWRWARRKDIPGIVGACVFFGLIMLLFVRVDESIPTVYRSVSGESRAVLHGKEVPYASVKDGRYDLIQVDSFEGNQLPGLLK
jgi:hypothetical protein